MDYYDFIGIGFGPSNLALAVALDEKQLQKDRLTYLFLEQKQSFAWQPGMLLPDTKMQISFLKDLATIRNPQSKYTFINYLKAVNRLNDFINMKTFFPTRMEYNNYLSWVAHQFDSCVHYGAEVLGVEPFSDCVDEVNLLKIHVKDVNTGEISIYYARNLVLATGGVPNVPTNLADTESFHITHSHRFIEWMAESAWDREKKLHFVVAGSGQSAAEVIHHLYQEFPNAQITSTIRKSSYKPADDSHFVNEVFFPQVVDFMYSMTPDKRNQYLDEHQSTNYAVIDLELIEKLYELMYNEKVTGRKRFSVVAFKELVNATEDGDTLKLQYKDVITEQTYELECDALILATGYTRKIRNQYISMLSPYLILNEEQEPIIKRDYCLSTTDVFKPRVYAQGYSEPTHGISDTLLSILAIRSQEIVDSLLAHREEQRNRQYEFQV